MKIPQVKIKAEDIKAHALLSAKKRRTLIKKYKIRKMSNYDLATLFGKSLSQIEKDLTKIRDEIWGHLKTDKGSKEVLKEIYSELRMVNDEVVEGAWDLGSKTDQDTVKLGCLKLIRESQSDVIKVMQSLGIVLKAPERVEHSGEVGHRISDEALDDEIKDLMKGAKKAKAAKPKKKKKATKKEGGGK